MAQERDDWEPETEDDDPADEAEAVSDEDRAILAEVKKSGMSAKELLARARAHVAGEKSGAGKREDAAADEADDDPDRVVTAKEARAEAERIADQRTRQAMNRMAIDAAVDEAIAADSKCSALVDSDAEVRGQIERMVAEKIIADPGLSGWSTGQFRAKARSFAGEAIKRLRQQAARWSGEAAEEPTEESEELDRRLAAGRATGDSGGGGAGSGKRTSGKKARRDDDDEKASNEDNLPFGDPEADWAKLGRENERSTKRAVRDVIRRQTAGA